MLFCQIAGRFSKGRYPWDTKVLPIAALDCYRWNCAKNFISQKLVDIGWALIYAVSLSSQITSRTVNNGVVEEYLREAIKPLVSRADVHFILRDVTINKHLIEKKTDQYHKSNRCEVLCGSDLPVGLASNRDGVW